MARWTRAADLWCGLLLEGHRDVGAGLYDELQRHVSGQPTTLAARQCEASAAARAAAGAGAWRLSLGAAVPRGLPARGRPRAGRCRLRCGAGQSAVGDAARGHRRRRPALRRAGGRAGADALHPRLGALPAAGPRAREPVPAVRGTGAAGAAAGRSLRPDPAVGHPDRRRQRRVAPDAARHLRHRHVARDSTIVRRSFRFIAACGSWCWRAAAARPRRPFRWRADWWTPTCSIGCRTIRERVARTFPWCRCRARCCTAGIRRT